MRFDVHDHLVNFMAPRKSVLEARELTLIKNLFGGTGTVQTEDPTNAVKLDIPLL
jgi:hypothetical protein